jgi:DNA-binding transcriptional LysR family regulator
MEQVRDGSLDASFYFGEIGHESISGLRLGDVRICVVAPADWAPRVLNADWNAVAAMPWILPPGSSSFSPLLRELFAKHSVQPVKVVEADNEGVATSLVESGVGLSLMREDGAQQRQAAGSICIWEPARLTTALWFIYAADRATDPLIGALREVLREIWQVQPSAADLATRPRAAKAARPARRSKA